jgi:hypothetical protein
MQEQRQPEAQDIFKDSVKNLAQATSNVLDAWYTLNDTDEEELHLNERHTDCEKCDIMGKAYRAIYTESMEEVTLLVAHWGDALGAS